MALSFEDLETPSGKKRRDTLGGPENGRCQLCGKPLGANASSVVMDHETSEFLSDVEAGQRNPDAISLYEVGADCRRRITAALAKQG